MYLICIVIDDEEGSRFQLIETIEQVPALKLAKSFSNVPDALRWMENNGPVDVVFSDIEMDDWNGLDAVRTYHRLSRYVIITTAYEQYWSEAIRKCVDGYLIKPVNYRDIAEQLETLLEKKLKKENQDHYWDVFCFFKEPKGQHHRIRISEIIYLEKQDNNYTHVIMQDAQEFRLRSTIKEAELHLFRFNFIRIHQSILVPFDHIVAYDATSVTLSNGKSLPLGSTYKAQLMNKLQHVI